MRTSMWWIAVVVIGCGDSSTTPPDAISVDAAQAVQLQLSLERRDAAGPDVIVVDLFVQRGTTAVVGADVVIEADAGAVGAVADHGDGHYLVDVTPAASSGNVAIRARALGAEVRRTAVVLPTIDPAWGQPEQVPGVVNTPGYEDSAEVSPDGAWLIVSSYASVDLICCLAAIPQICTGAVTAADPASVACNTSVGPYAAPERPDLPGAERILSATQIHDALPRLGLDEPIGTDLPFAAPPLAAYGFHRQADGSFGEPFSIAFDADGLTSAPFGFTFATLNGSAATVVYAWDDVRTSGTGPGNTGTDLFHADLALGARVVLGTFTFSGAINLDREPTPVPLVDAAGQSGNPGVAPDGIFFDAEQGDNDLHFAAGDPLGSGPLAAAVTVALSDPAHAEYQPYVHDGRLYYSRDFVELRSAARGAGDVAQPATWSGDHVELGVDLVNDVGRVLAIGEPSLSLASGTTELYFVYGIRTATGIDQGIARVRRR